MMNKRSLHTDFKRVSFYMIYVLFFFHTGFDPTGI